MSRIIVHKPLDSDYNLNEIGEVIKRKLIIHKLNNEYSIIEFSSNKKPGTLLQLAEREKLRCWTISKP